MPSFLLEIGTEEIPARFTQRALKDLNTLVSDLLETQELLEDNAEFQNYGTARRLVLAINGVKAGRDARSERMTGPPLRIAKDADGKWQTPAIKFAEKAGVSVDDLGSDTDAKGQEILVATKESPAESSIQILQGALPDLLRQLPLPIAMRWSNQDQAFIRPVQWIVSLLDSDVIPFDAWGHIAGNQSRGHRFLSGESSTFIGKTVTIPSASDYAKTLADASVTVDIDTRRKGIIQQLDAAAAAENASYQEDEGLVSEHVFLGESPTVISASFNPDFLKVPADILEKYMKAHQRYFPLYQDGAMLARFLIVADSVTSENQASIRDGNERVLSARLADLLFFWDTDQKKSLDAHCDALNTIVFQDGFGTMADKSTRIHTLSEYLINATGLQSKAESIFRTCALAKMDLVTHMVGELPTLQGNIGAYYADAAGESPEVVSGIREHYLPKFDGDNLAEVPEGYIVGIADRIDTIVATYAGGRLPSSSKDPWGVRRAMLAIIRSCLAKEIPVSLTELVDEAIGTLGATLSTEHSNALKRFFIQRLEYVLLDLQIPRDIVEAVLSAQNLGSPLLIKQTADAIQDFIGKEDSESIKTMVESVVRIGRLGRKATLSPDVNPELYIHPPYTVNPEAFVLPIESQLWEAYEKQADALSDPSRFCSAILSLVPLCTQYFDEVLVMDKDEAVKRNRLGMLSQIHQGFSQLANFEKILSER